MAPVAVRSAPAEREQSQQKLLNFGCGAIAQSSEIRNQAGVPKKDRYREVGGDREDVPHQRAAEVRPDSVIVREWRQEPRHPDSANVNAGENGSAHDREQG